MINHAINRATGQILHILVDDVGNKLLLSKDKHPLLKLVDNWIFTTPETDVSRDRITQAERFHKYKESRILIGFQNLQLTSRLSAFTILCRSTLFVTVTLRTCFSLNRIAISQYSCLLIIHLKDFTRARTIAQDS